MGNVTKVATIQFKNLLKYKGILTPEQINFQISAMMKYVELNCLEHYKKVIILNKGDKLVEGTRKLDVELYLFVEDKFQPYSAFEFIDELTLSNCLHNSHFGEPSGVPGAVSEMAKYMWSNNLFPLSKVYQVVTEINNTKTQYDLYLKVSNKY